jgi:hypothetical protein
MGKHFQKGADYHGTPEWIPENIDAAAELAVAVLRVGLTRKTESSPAAVITLNGKPLEVPLEDCAERLADGEYGVTKLVNLNVADLQAENTVKVSFPDGDDGVVGTVVIRAAIVE